LDGAGGLAADGVDVPVEALASEPALFSLPSFVPFGSLAVSFPASFAPAPCSFLA
jgi:hypothetical protein